MKIIVLMGSPNLDGSTNLLVKEFEKGATEAGHSVENIDVVKEDIHACKGCVSCGYEGPCVQQDAMQKIKGKILGADMLVFATPLYYYGMSSQLKAVVDRFCFFNSSLTRKRIKSALIAVAWNSDMWTFEVLEKHYKTLVNYLKMNDQGMVLGRGCGTPNMTSGSKYMREAYDFGKGLK